MEEGDAVDEVWVKDHILDLHTSSVHPPHTRNCSLPFSLSLLVPSGVLAALICIPLCQ